MPHQYAVKPTKDEAFPLAVSRIKVVDFERSPEPQPRATAQIAKSSERKFISSIPFRHPTFDSTRCANPLIFAQRPQY
jgi:hypothetical protein